MTNSYRKDVLVLLIISVALTSFSSLFLALHAFYPFNGGSFTKNYLYYAIYLFTFALLEIFIIFRLGKYKAAILCKIIGIYSFIFFPILLLLSFYFGLLFTKEVTSWNYILVIVVFGINIIYQFAMSLYISNRLIEENKGYVVIKNISWMIIGLSTLIFLFYICSIIKASFVDISQSDIAKALGTGYYITSGIELLVMIAMSFWIFYVGYSAFLSGITDNLVDVKHNVKFTRAIMKKYHVNFYFSVVVMLFFLIVSIVASFTFFKRNFSLMALYLSLLLIIVPLHYYDLHLVKKYKDDEETIFRKKHIPLIYSGIIFLIYASIVIIFGASNQGKNLDDKNILAVFIIFLPYALARLFNSIRKIVKYKQSYNPTFLATLSADVVLTLFTITNVIIMFGFSLNNLIFVIIAVVLVFSLIVFCIIIAIYLIVVGICGLTNKRQKTYENYLKSHNEIE